MTLPHDASVPQAYHDDLLRRYDQMAIRASYQVIQHYSTSFSLATRVLGKSVRTDIRNLYAMVRIADEIVDGTARAGGMNAADIASLLDAYEHAVLTAPQVRFHPDPVLHAYAMSARRCSFHPDHISAFFASMRRDLTQSTHDAASLDDYVYGSSEVIGLLCLSAFLVDHPVSDVERDRLESGARALGTAFQKINFLRDLAEDSRVLGRSYFPQTRRCDLTEDTKDELIADIRSDLDQAHTVMPLVPLTARTGVMVAAGIFSELTERIDRLPATSLYTTRVSVPNRTKMAILAKAIRHAHTLHPASGPNKKGR